MSLQPNVLGLLTWWESRWLVLSWGVTAASFSLTILYGRYIADDSPVRVIDVDVDELDLTTSGTVAKIDEFERFGGAGALLGLRHFAPCQRQSEVFRHRHMQPQGVGLEDKAKVVFLRRDESSVSPS